jgi:hypothetical protein
MSEQQLPYASSLTLEEIEIVGLNGESKSIGELVVRFDYFESIDLPTVHGTLDIVDTGVNLISTLPIQGYEDVNLKFKYGSGDDEVIEYSFKVYKIFNRFSSERFQKYSLGLISKEALVNETQKVPLTLAGKPDALVRTLLSEGLSSAKTFRGDPTLFKVRMLPGKKTPFSIINSLRTKAVHEDVNIGTSSSSTDGSLSKSSGTAGYYFYENSQGYNFRSIDVLNDVEKNPPVATFTLEPGQLKEENAPNKILDIDFENEIDILAKLRRGAYSNVICFYNFSTGAYEEYVYNLGDNFDDMKHLGSQSGLAKGQAELAVNPSRIMSVLLDHETWFDGTEVASPEDKDGGKKDTAEFPDWQKNYIAQNISRLESQNNQQLKIKLPTRLDIKVGDTVEVLVPNYVPTNQKAKEGEDIHDKEHSGVYLVAKLNHALDPKSAKGNTYLTLVRDSYGMPDEDSEVKT